MAWHRGFMGGDDTIFTGTCNVRADKNNEIGDDDDDDIANAVSDGVYSLTHSSQRVGGNEDKRCIAGKFLAYGKLIFLIFVFNAQ